MQDEDFKVTKSNDAMLGEIDYDEFCEFLDSQVFLVHDMLLADIENYNMYFNKFYTYMKQGFERPEVRKHPIRFKFTDNPREPVKEMEIRHMIVNMIHWRPFIIMDKVEDLGPQHVMDCKHLTAKYRDNWINTYIIDPYRKMFSNDRMNIIIERVIADSVTISNDFNVIMAMTMNIESFIDIESKNKRVSEIIHTQIPDGWQPKEIEKTQHELMVEFIDILKQEPDMCLYPMLNAGTGIKDKQLSEFAIIGGLKPDINGNTLPTPINSNFLINGLNNVTNYYIDAQAGRKSIILNKSSMGTSGHFSTMCIQVASTVNLSRRFCHDIAHGIHGNHYGCNTKRPLVYHIDSPDKLKNINRRYYYLEPTMVELRCVNAKHDKWLIGKTVFLRSPMTCTCEDGICPICYGDLAYTNAEIEFTIGAYAAAKLNNKLSQNILSTKHLLTTNSEEIVFCDLFYQFFKLDSYKFKVDMDSTENFYDWYIRILNDDIFEFNAKEEGDFNYFIERFFLYNKKTKECVEIKELNKTQTMYLYEDVLKMFTKSKDKNFDGVELCINDLADDETYFAVIIIENNELTKPLKNIMRLLNRKDHYDCETIDDLLNKMNDLLIECGHNLQSVHAECIMRTIIKDTDNILMQPRFDDISRLNKYQILTIGSALMNNPSLTVSYSFQDLGKQVTNPNTNLKCEKSSYDYLYSETIPTHKPNVNLY